MNGAEAYTRELTVETELLPDAMVRFTVTDTGRGIDPEWTDHIFDALYTTKAEGTGMGLAISRSIVEAHGGRIWAAPHPGRGAEFYFILPGKLSGGT